MAPVFQVPTLSALTLASIPSAINTYERALVYFAQACQSIANGQEVNVQAGAESSPMVQVQVAVTADNVPRFVVTAYLPVDLDAINSATEKTWMATKDIALAAPHINFATN